jgi:hypothetical protein
MPIAERFTKARARVRTEDKSETGEVRRAGAAGIAHRGDAARIAQAIGVLAHVRAIDKDVRMDVDEPRGHEPAFGADVLACVLASQRSGNLDDLAAADPDVHAAAQPAAGIDHLAVTDQQIVLHDREFPAFDGIKNRDRRSARAVERRARGRRGSGGSSGAT